MTSKKDKRVFVCSDESDEVVAFKIRWDRKLCFIEELLDFSRNNGIEYRIVERFGTRGSTDLVVVLPSNAVKMEKFLRYSGVFVSRHSACNVAGKLLRGWKESDETEILTRLKR